MSLFSSSAGLRGSPHCPPTAVCLPLSFLPPESSIAFTPAPHPALSFSRTPGTPHARASARAGPSARSAPPQKSMAPTLLQVFFFFYLNVTFPMRSFSHMIYLSALLSFSPLHWTLMEHTVYVTNSSTFLYVPRKDKLHEDRDFSPLYPQHLGYRGHAIV